MSSNLSAYAARVEDQVRRNKKEGTLRALRQVATAIKAASNHMEERRLESPREVLDAVRAVLADVVTLAHIAGLEPSEIDRILSGEKE